MQIHPVLLIFLSLIALAAIFRACLLMYEQASEDSEISLKNVIMSWFKSLLRFPRYRAKKLSKKK